jgi:hypothetical protein
MSCFGVGVSQVKEGLLNPKIQMKNTCQLGLTKVLYRIFEYNH